MVRDIVAGIGGARDTSTGGLAAPPPAPHHSNGGALPADVPGFLMVEPQSRSSAAGAGVYAMAGGGEFDGDTSAHEAALGALQTPIMVLDEIDAGIGPRLGTSIGRMLHRMSVGGQTLCVSHVPQARGCSAAARFVRRVARLAQRCIVCLVRPRIVHTEAAWAGTTCVCAVQVAAYADRHTLVSKVMRDSRAETEFVALESTEARVTEVAAMLDLDRAVAQQIVEQAREDVQQRACSRAEAEAAAPTHSAPDVAAATASSGPPQDTEQPALNASSAHSAGAGQKKIRLGGVQQERARRGGMGSMQDSFFAAAARSSTSDNLSSRAADAPEAPATAGSASEAHRAGDSTAGESGGARTCAEPPVASASTRRDGFDALAAELPASGGSIGLQSDSLPHSSEAAAQASGGPLRRERLLHLGNNGDRLVRSNAGASSPRPGTNRAAV